MRPVWTEGESWPGYLLRFSNSNELQGIDRLAAMLRLTPKMMLASSPHEICKLLGVSVMAPAYDSPVGKVRINRLARLADARRSLYGRLCPRCIEPGGLGHIPAIWDIAVNMRCPSHRTFLLDRCPSCECPISYRRKELKQCDCGFRYWEAQTQTQTPALLAAEDVLKVADLRTEGMKTFAVETDKGLAAQRFLRRILKASIPELLDADLRKPGHFPARIFTHAEFNQISDWFTAWPSSFIDKLEAIHQQFRTLGRMDRSRGLLRRSGYPEIEQLVKSSRPEILANNRSLRQMRFAWSEGAHGARVVDVLTCSKLTGVNEYLIKRWVKLGWLGDVTLSKMPNGRTKYEIGYEEVMAVVGFLSRTSTPKLVSQELGLSYGAIRVMMDHGVFKYVDISGAVLGRRLNTAQTVEFADSILKQVKLEPDRGESWISLSSALECLGKRSSCNANQFYRSVLNCQMDVFMPPDAPRTLAHVYCCRSNFMGWIVKQRGAPVGLT